MPSLPTPGSGNWGAKLNAWLRVAHHDDGTLRANGGGLGGMALRATTGADGYTLGGTGTITGWPVPGDGALHRVLIGGTLDVTATATGGAVTITFTSPAGTTRSTLLLGPNQPAGVQIPGPFMLTVKAGTTVSLTQSTPLTAGAAVLYADIWGA